MKKHRSRLLSLILAVGLLVSLLPLEAQASEIAETAYEAFIEHDVPAYYQNDYPNNRYGAGSIATNGCGVAVLASLATYITGHEYLPDELARWFGGVAENNIERFENGATTLGLPWVRAENIDTATSALNEGKLLVVMMDGFSFHNPFTASQHFILIRGITTDGRYLVNDPNRSNYDKWELKEGFEKGFPRSTIVAGYSGAWVFDPYGLPADFEPYHREEYPRQENYPGVVLTYEEQELLAKLIWAEARGECAEGQQAVAEVVLNRLVSGKFGESISGVILSPGQFRGVEQMEKAEPWQAQYDAIDAALYGEPVLEKDVFFFATEPLTSQVFAEIGGHIFCRGEP